MGTTLSILRMRSCRYSFTKGLNRSVSQELANGIRELDDEYARKTDYETLFVDIGCFFPNEITLTRDGQRIVISCETEDTFLTSLLNYGYTDQVVSLKRILTFSSSFDLDKAKASTSEDGRVIVIRIPYKTGCPPLGLMRRTVPIDIAPGDSSNRDNCKTWFWSCWLCSYLLTKCLLAPKSMTK